MQYIYEHIIAKAYNWSLEEIRSLDYYDFQVHLRMCIVSESVDNEFKMSLAGHSTSKVASNQLEKVFDPATGEFRDTKKSIEKIYQKYDPKTGLLLGDKNANSNVRE